MNIRAVRRKTAALLNGLLISTVGAKIVPARSKTFSCKRVRSSNGRTVMVVSNAGSQAEVEVRDGSPDWMTFDQIFIDEDYDLRRLARSNELQQLYNSMIAKGETPLILDLGANVGFSAVYFHLIWPEARIVAVEPDADNVEQLTKNTSGLGVVEVIAGAIAGRPGVLRIEDPAAGKNAVRVVDSTAGSGSEVAAITVGDIFEHHCAQGCRPFIVKIDIEGGEAGLFSEATDWIDSVPLLIVELHDWLYPRERTSRNFLAAMATRDRDFVYVDENVFSISNGHGAV